MTFLLLFEIIRHNRIPRIRFPKKEEILAHDHNMTIFLLILPIFIHNFFFYYSGDNP